MIICDYSLLQILTEKQGPPPSGTVSTWSPAVTWCLLKVIARQKDFSLAVAPTTCILKSASPLPSSSGAHDFNFLAAGREGKWPKKALAPCTRATTRAANQVSTPL